MTDHMQTTSAAAGLGMFNKQIRVSMSELRQRKVPEVDAEVPSKSVAKPVEAAAKRQGTNSSRELLLFAAPLVLFLHVALVSQMAVTERASVLAAGQRA